MWPFKKKRVMPCAGPIKVKVETDPRLFQLIEYGENERHKNLSKRKFKKGMEQKDYKVKYEFYRSDYLDTVVTFIDGIAETIRMDNYSQEKRELISKKGLKIGTTLDKWICLNIEDIK